MDETNYHSSAESFAHEFIEMLENNDSSLLKTNGISISTGNFEIHFFTPEENKHANDSLIQLVRDRMDLFKPAVESESFNEFLIATKDLATWLEQRGIVVGLNGNTLMAKIKLKMFSWFPFLFGV